MKLLIFVALLASVAAIKNVDDIGDLTEEKWEAILADDETTPEQLGLIINSQVKKGIRSAIAQMPCGWPELGIPALAPYTNGNLELSLKAAVFEELAKMFKFRFDGLDEMEIKKLDIGFTFGKKVKFDFNFPELRATAFNLNTDTLIDTLQQLGISVRYEGAGPMEFSLENLRIKGHFKYKMPMFVGSIKIYKFEAVVTLGGVHSEIGGILGNGNFNQFINEKIEYIIPAFINGKQEEISEQIEKIFVPRVNAFMKGKKLWDLLGMVGGSNKFCDPTPAPWSLN